MIFTRFTALLILITFTLSPTYVITVDKVSHHSCCTSNQSDCKNCTSASEFNNHVNVEDCDYCEVNGCCETDFNKNKHANNTPRNTYKLKNNICYYKNPLDSFLTKSDENTNILTFYNNRLNNYLPTFTTHQLLTVSLLC